MYILNLGLTLFVLVSPSLANLTSTEKISEDGQLTVPQLITKYGYPVETHTVTTVDGYILTIHRIPHGQKGQSGKNQVVFLQHGLLCSAADWLIPGPSKSLAYILADAGYDVWMGNARGTRYSRNHTYLHPDKNAAKFWKFSWHEIGIYDLPTMIDYAIAKTKQEKIFYIGHSQGTTAFYVMCSEKPEYNDKFIAQFSLAPVAYVGLIKSPLIRLLAFGEPGLGLIADLIGLHEFRPSDELMEKLGGSLCSENSIFQLLCINSIFAVCGFNKKQTNETLLPIIMGHTPAGASTKQLLHYAQEVNSRKFRQWDYGIFGNRKYYGSMRPPKYNFKNIKAPLYFFYSNNDWMAHQRDVLKLYRKVGNVKGKFLVPDKRFNHADYIYGIDANKLIYVRILSLLKRYL